MSKYNFDKEVNRFNTGSIKYDYIKKNNLPSDTIPLWIADMDFETSDEIINAMIKTTKDGIFGYTDFGDEYYDTVIDWLKNEHNTHINKENIIRTPGVIVALSLGVRILTKENDNVIILNPVYNPFREVIKNNNRNIIESNLKIENNKYYIDFEDFENKIKDNNVKLFIMCSPHNPVGRVWNIDELTTISNICEKYNVKIISDEIHFDFIWEGYKHTVATNISNYMKENSIICTAPSKTFNLAGLQDSNIIILNDDIKKLFIKEYEKFGYHRISQFAQIATMAAYKYGKEWLDEVKKYIYDNILYVKNYIKENIKNINAIDIEGTYLMWIDFRKFDLSVEDLNKKLVYDAKVQLNNGAVFGQEGFMRMNIATRRKNLEIALDNIRKAFK